MLPCLAEILVVVLVWRKQPQGATRMSPLTADSDGLR